MLDSFQILRPWFFVLLPLILFIVWKLAQVLSHISPWDRSVSDHLRKFMISTGENSNAVARPYQQKMLGWLFGLLLLALVGPTFWKKPIPGAQIKPQVIILLDETLSMLAQDVKPSRYKRARYIVQDLLQQIPEASVGLTVYAGSNHPLVPMTYALDIVKQSVATIDPQLMPVPGNNALNALSSVSTSMSGLPKATLVWITDEVKPKDHQDVIRLLQRQDFKTVIVGVGTDESGPIELRSGDLLRDSQGNIVIPDYKPEDMKSIAKAIGGVFYDQKELYGTKMQQLADLIESRTSVDGRVADDAQTAYFDQWEDLGPWFLIPAALLMAGCFRKGYLFAFLMFIPMLPWPQTAMATTLSDKKAYEAYQQQKYAQAAVDADDPLLKGTALYKSELYEEAAQALATAAAENTPETAEKGSYPVRAYYNLGNALAQTGQLDAAIGAYDQVLKWIPDDADALANRQIVEDIKKAQQEQEQDNSDNSDSTEQQQDSQNASSQQDDSKRQDQSQGNSSDSESDAQNSQQTAAQDAARKAQEEALKKAMENLTQKAKQTEAAEQQAKTEEEARQQQAEQDRLNQQAEQETQDKVKESEEAQASKQQESVENPHLEALKLQPGAVLRNKMIRQYQLTNQRNQQHNQQGSQDDIW